LLQFGTFCGLWQSIRATDAGFVNGLIGNANRNDQEENDMKDRITTQPQLRREFWQTFPYLSQKRIKDHAGTGEMYCTDTRCAWCDWIDGLSSDGDISQELAGRATL